MTAGNSLRFRVRAQPAPRTNLTVEVTIAYAGCEVARSSKSVTIAAGDSSTTLTVKTDGAAAGCTVTATIAGGEGYRAGRTADGASASVDVSAATDSTPPRPPPAEPTVTIEADTTRVVLGSELIFTLTATPPPDSDLEVTVQWSDPGAFLAERGRQQVTIPTAGTFKLRKPTEDDVAYQGEVEVTAALVAGSGYAIGTPASATVTVTGSVASTPRRARSNSRAGARARARAVEVFPRHALPACVCSCSRSRDRGYPRILHVYGGSGATVRHHGSVGVAVQTGPLRRPS